MLVSDLFDTNAKLSPEAIQKLRVECAEFLSEVNGQPLIKHLPPSLPVFSKVKVRQRRHHNALSEAFNRAFEQQCPLLRQRAVLAKTTHLSSAPNVESYHIFPINGYKYVYCCEVKDSTAEYDQLLSSLYSVGTLSITEATNIVTDLLRYTYVSTNLQEAFDARAEVIVYNVPYYYAIRSDVAASYHNVIYNNS